MKLSEEQEKKFKEKVDRRYPTLPVCHHEAMIEIINQVLDEPEKPKWEWYWVFEGNQEQITIFDSNRLNIARRVERKVGKQIVELHNLAPEILKIFKKLNPPLMKCDASILYNQIHDTIKQLEELGVSNG